MKKLPEQKHTGAGNRAAIAAVFFTFTLGIFSLTGCSGGDKADSGAGSGSEQQISDLPLPEIPEQDPEEPSATPVNIIIAGLDKYGNTDTVIVAHMSFKNNKINIVSIPRDTQVDIPGRKSPSKIAWAGRDGEKLSAAATNLLGIDTDYYAILDLGAAEKVIDAFGGVEIDVEKNMKYTDSIQKLYIDLRKGKQLLDGEKALHYARFRKDSRGDLGRIARQQKLCRALADKAFSLEFIPKLPGVIKTLLETDSSLIRTNMSATEAYNIVKQSGEGIFDNISSVTVPGIEKYSAGSFFLVPDEAELTKIAETMK
ncbi:LCP family protein [bacterium]